MRKISLLFLSVLLVSCTSQRPMHPKSPQVAKEKRFKSISTSLKNQSANCSPKLESDLKAIQADWNSAIENGLPNKERAFEAMTFFLRYSSTPDPQTFLYRDYLHENYLLISSKVFLQNHLWVLCPVTPYYDTGAALLKSFEKSYFDLSQKSRIARRVFAWVKSPSLSSTALLLKLGLVVRLVKAEQATAPAATLAKIEAERKEVVKYNETFSRRVRNYRDSDKLPSNFDVSEKELRAYAELYYEDLLYTLQKEERLEKLYREVLLK